MYSIIYSNKYGDEYNIYHFRPLIQIGQELFSQIKWIYEEVINVLHYQTLVSATDRRIQKYRAQTINSKYQEQHGMKKLNYVIDFILCPIFRAILRASSRVIGNFFTNRYGKQGKGRGVSVIPLRNADKIFYMANFTKNLPIENYSLYYLTSKTLVFR